MMKMNIVIERREPMPQLKAMGKERFQKIGEHVVSSSIQNINSRKQVNDSGIKTNDKSTTKAKQRRGVADPKSLIDIVKRFVTRSYYRIKTGTNYVEIDFTENKDTANINRYVQEMGYKGWFGLNRNHKSKVRDIVREWLLQQLRRR